MRRGTASEIGRMWWKWQNAGWNEKRKWKVFRLFLLRTESDTELRTTNEWKTETQIGEQWKYLDIRYVVWKSEKNVVDTTITIRPSIWPPWTSSQVNLEIRIHQPGMNSCICLRKREDQQGRRKFWLVAVHALLLFSNTGLDQGEAMHQKGTLLAM